MGRDLSVQTRTPSLYSSTFPTERVTVLTKSGPLDLLCKYGLEYRDHITGHRRGVEYEAIMYRHLLPDRSLATPRCHGTFRTIGSTQCLVLDFIDGYRVHHSPYPFALLWTCTDLARFHTHGPRTIPTPLNVFDRPYFTRWATQVLSLDKRDGPVRQVIAKLHDSMNLVIDVLIEAPKTIIHGELYPDNVVVQESRAVVVDWESAGLGPGVLDLAVLTQGNWDSDLVEECEATYWRHSGLPDKDQAARSLAAARVFAAAQLLYHLGRKETDGSKEAQAANEIRTQLAILTTPTAG